MGYVEGRCHAGRMTESPVARRTTDDGPRTTVPASLHRRHARVDFMRLGSLGDRGVRGKRTSRLSRGDGTEGGEGRILLVGDGEEAVKLHDAEEVAHDGLDVEEDDLAVVGIDATLQAHEDGDARAGEVIDLLEVDGQQGALPVLHQLIQRVAEGVVPEVV